MNPQFTWKRTKFIETPKLDDIRNYMEKRANLLELETELVFDIT